LLSFSVLEDQNVVDFESRIEMPKSVCGKNRKPNFFGKDFYGFLPFGLRFDRRRRLRF